jgi:hypothetical protein
MKSWFPAVILVLGLASVLVIVPNILPPRVVLSRNACVTNLDYLRDKKAEWVRRSGSTSGVAPTERDLFGEDWIFRMPNCPAGGKYSIGRVGEDPVCSIGPPVHALPRSVGGAGTTKRDGLSR